MHFLYRGQDCSQIPRDVTHICIDPSVKVIDWAAFGHCKQLVEVEFWAHSDIASNWWGWSFVKGLRRIGEYSFNRCESLSNIKIPSTVNVIGSHAFSDCVQLVKVELCEGLGQIDCETFVGCLSLPNIKIPSTVKKIGWGAFAVCKQLISVELCESLQEIEGYAFQNCHSLRSLCIPPSAQVVSHCFIGCHDLLMLFGSQEKIELALKSRFVGLPVHELCYHQSRHPAEVALKITQLKNLVRRVPLAENNQDCLGMTPLHILACATRHNLDLYQLIIANQPGSLTTKDKWGCLPILYAIWSKAPQEIVQFLIDAQKSAFPSFILNWDKMIETLCRAGASLDIIGILLDTQQTSFSEQSVDLQKVSREFGIRCLVSDSSFSEFFPIWRSLMEAFGSSHQELIQSMLAVEQGYFPDQNDIDWKRLCEEFVQPLNEWWNSDSTYASLKTFAFLVKCNIPERLGMLGVRKWRLDIQNVMHVDNWNAQTRFDMICSKLATYENDYPHLKDITSLLKLAIWKSKVDESVGSLGKTMDDDASLRQWKHQCRINCGAGTIIPNVLPFLIG